MKYVPLKKSFETSWVNKETKKAAVMAALRISVLILVKLKADKTADAKSQNGNKR